MAKHLFLSLCLSSIVVTCAFAPLSLSSLQSKTHPSASVLQLTPEELSPVVEGFRKESFFWLIGASGGAGIARGQFPKMFANTQVIRRLKDVPPSEGGELLGISPLCGYPQDLYKADLAKVVNNPKSVEQIVKENPKPDNFLAVKGYLIYDAFVDGNPGCNPLTVRAVFDTFAQSTNVVNPEIAQEKLDSFKADHSGETFKTALLSSKLQGYAAIGTLLFLLGLADIFAFRDVAFGWFPDWPGIENFPMGLIDPGFWTIPQYWI